MDLLMWELDVADREKILPVIFELAEKVEPEHGIRLRHDDAARLRRDLDLFPEIYNEAWERNWGFVPYDEEDLDAYAQELQLVFDEHWFMIAETDGDEAVGVAITVPDVNQVLRRMNGRLLPFGWWHFLRRRKISTACASASSASSPSTSTPASPRSSTSSTSTRPRATPLKAARWAGSSRPTSAMNRGMEAMGGEVVKRYRIYERLFEPTPSPRSRLGWKVWQPEREAPADPRRRGAVARCRGGSLPGDEREPAEELEVVDEVAGVLVRARRHRCPSAPAARWSPPRRAGRDGFVAGAATAVVVAHRRARKRASARAPARRRGNGNGSALEIAATRSFLVDVHLLEPAPVSLGAGPSELAPRGAPALAVPPAARRPRRRRAARGGVL